jgi:hypothetical protein
MGREQELLTNPVLTHGDLMKREPPHLSIAQQDSGLGNVQFKRFLQVVAVQISSAA